MQHLLFCTRLNTFCLLIGGLFTAALVGSKTADSATEVDPGTARVVIQNACGSAATKTHTLQGDGASSPLAGTTRTVEAVVVGDFQGREALSGFFLQEQDAEQDGNPLTSEGVFVFQGRNTQPVNVGDLVRVTGIIHEYFGMTQISAQTVSVCASGFAVTPATLTLPVTDLRDLERLEGMAVVVPQELTVTDSYNLGRYGELSLSAGGRLFNPTHLSAPGTAAAAVAAENQLRRILLDDGSRRQNPPVIPFPSPQLSAHNSVRTGDTVATVRGVLHFAFSQYRIQPTHAPVFRRSNPRISRPVKPAASDLTVASFNLLNYFNGNGRGGGFPTSRGADTAAEFGRQRSKIIAALVAMDADVVALMEIENDGYGPESAINDLVHGLADAGLDYAAVNPGVDRLGSDEITVGFIYKPNSVVPRKGSAVLDSSVDTRFIDSRNRPVLAQTFREAASDGTFTVAVTHFKSKGSGCDDLDDRNRGDGQGNCNLTRTAAAMAMVEWLAADPTRSGDGDVLILGDINAYAMEDPITTIEAAGYTNLVRKHLGKSAYTYVFAGQAGYLDHAFASASFASQVMGAADWHINADEPRVLDYTQKSKTKEQVASLYSESPWRSSDHDPLIVFLNLHSPVQAPPGNIDKDGLLSLQGFALLLSHLGKEGKDIRAFDLDLDGTITFEDLSLWRMSSIRREAAANPDK